VKLSDRLEEVLADVGKAASGRWRWSTNGNIVPEAYADDCEIAAVYSEHMDDLGVPDNANAIIAAVNFIREHGPALVDLARRVEGAGRAFIMSNAAPEPHQVAGVTAADDDVINALDGQRVRLVPEVGA